MRWAPTRWWVWPFTLSYSPSSFGFTRGAVSSRNSSPRGAQQARNLLRVELHRVSAQNLGLGEPEPGVTRSLTASCCWECVLSNLRRMNAIRG